MLNLYKLEIFAIVVETGSFSAAADRLLMTQPAVSQHIQDLEASLGTRLFARGRRGVVLTSAGETLHDYTRSILRMVAEAENAVTDVQHLASGQVSVAATPGVSVYRLPEWIQGFRAQYPNLTVSVQTSITPQIVADLRGGRIDLGLIEGELDGLDWPQLGVIELETDEQFVIVGPKHPWWDWDGVKCEDLNDQLFVMRQRNSQTRIWLDARLASAEINVKVAAEFDNVESIKRAVAQGMGITILPWYAVQSEQEIGLLRALPVEGGRLQRKLKLIWNKGRIFSPVTRTFLRFLGQSLPPLAQMQI
ncbi:MAG: LysR family transcriptional regulator [Caldilineaceae bacterium]|nr:LysR family transcriptional regulator [Caldilineaceae bacterium]